MMKKDQLENNDGIMDSLLKQARIVVEKYENNCHDEDSQKPLRIELEKVRDELVDLQNLRILDLIEKDESLDNLPEKEYKIQKELTDLIVVINHLLGEEKW